MAVFAGRVAFQGPEEDKAFWVQVGYKYYKWRRKIFI